MPLPNELWRDLETGTFYLFGWYFNTVEEPFVWRLRQRRKFRKIMGLLNDAEGHSDIRYGVL